MCRRLAVGFQGVWGGLAILDAELMGFPSRKVVEAEAERGLELFPLACHECHSFSLCLEEWMWAWLDVFIVASSLWDVVVEVVTAIMEGQGTGAENG